MLETTKMVTVIEPLTGGNMARRIPITKEMIKTAKECAGQGMTIEQIAQMLGFGKTKVFKEMKANEDFAEAIRSGQAKGIEQVTNALFNSALGGNAVAMVFYLKNRAGWRDKQEVDLNAEVVLKTIDSFYEA